MGWLLITVLGEKGLAKLRISRKTCQALGEIWINASRDSEAQ